MVKAKIKAPRWGIYCTMPWGEKRLLGRVRAHTEDGARNEANARGRFKGWDVIKRLGESN